MHFHGPSLDVFHIQILEQTSSPSLEVTPVRKVQCESPASPLLRQVICHQQCVIIEYIGLANTILSMAC